MLTNRALRVLFNTLLDTYAERVEDVIPDVLPQRHGPIPLQTALCEAHFPAPGISAGAPDAARTPRLSTTHL